MDKSLKLSGLLITVGVLLAACAPIRKQGTQAMQSHQAERETVLRQQSAWSLRARLGVSDGEHVGSGSLTWKQQKNNFIFVVRAPISGRSFQLTQQPGRAELRGVGKKPIVGVDARVLLYQSLGWHIPIAALADWVRGLRAPEGAQGVAVIRYGDNGLPSYIEQNGWSIEYRDWFENRKQPLPRKVFASHGDYHVRLSIRNWHFPELQ